MKDAKKKEKLGCCIWGEEWGGRRGARAIKGKSGTNLLDYRRRKIMDLIASPEREGKKGKACKD